MDVFLSMLNIFGKGDISKDPYDDIVHPCQRRPRKYSRNHTMTHDASAKFLKSTNNGATHVEIRNLLEKFKTSIMSSTSSQLDVLHEKQK